MTARTPAWKWGVCGLLLLATMLNYMDRQTLSQMATDIGRELRLSNEDYGKLELGFGLAFAAGGVVTGILVDRSASASSTRPWCWPGRRRASPPRGRKVSRA